MQKYLQGINVYTTIGIEECQELVVPIFLRAGFEPVWVYGDTGPDNTLVKGAVAVLQERVDTLVKCFIVPIGSVRHSRVDHDNVVLIVTVEGINKLAHKFQRETLRIKCEHPALVHIIDCNIVSLCHYHVEGRFGSLSVCKAKGSSQRGVRCNIDFCPVFTYPHRFEWDVRLRVVCDDFSNFVNITHAVSALMEAEAPVWHHRALSDHFRVLLSSLNWCWARNEVKVDYTTDSVVLEELAVGVVDLDIHT